MVGVIVRVLECEDGLNIVIYQCSGVAVLPKGPTPCPACGDGYDQGTQPEHMFKSVCYCGHPRYYDFTYLDGAVTASGGPRRDQVTRTIRPLLVFAALIVE